MTNPIIAPGTYTFKRAIGLNVRTNASATAARVTTLEQGNAFTVLPDAPVTAGGYTWRKLTVGAATGWAAVSLLAPSDYEAYTVPEQPPADERILNALYVARGARDTVTALATALDTIISDLEAAIGTQAEPLAFVVGAIEVDTIEDDDIEPTTRIVPRVATDDDESEAA